MTLLMLLRTFLAWIRSVSAAQRPTFLLPNRLFAPRSMRTKLQMDIQ